MLQNKYNQFIVCAMSLIGLYAIFHQWELIGFSNAEVFGHVWSHSWRFEDWPNGLFGTDQTVGTKSFPIIDPIPTLVISFFDLFVPLFSAYNLFLLSSLALSALVLKNMILDPSQKTDWACLFLVLSSPIIWGSLNSGLTEDWGLFLPMMALISISKKQVLRAGLWVAISAYWGLVLGWMSAVFVSLYAIIHSVDRRELIKMWIVMGICVLPLVGFHWDRLYLGGHRSSAPPAHFEPMWMINPWHHTDLASLFWLGKVDFSSQIIRLHPASLGVVAIVFAFGCRDWRWWLMFVLCVGFALGPEIYWMGHSTGIFNPFHWFLNLVPGSSLLNHHGRWMLMASICWIVMVVQGMKRFKVLQWATPIIMLEWLLVTPVGFPLMGTKSIETSLVLNQMTEMQIPQEKRVLRIPVRGPGVVFQQSLYEQTIHKLPLWMNPNRPNPSEWFRLNEQSQWIETIAFTKELPSGSCVPKTVASLLVSEPFVDLFIKSWGKPTLQDDQYALWEEVPHCGSVP